MTTSSRKTRLLQFPPPPFTVPFERPEKTKVIVIMGATGTGKSRLSLEFSRPFPASELINSDKMQVYTGLDITTNKVDTDADPSGFRSSAGIVAEIVGGRSKSFLRDLLAGTLEGPESPTYYFTEYLRARIQEMEEILDGSVCEEAIGVPKPNAYLRKYARGKAQNTGSFRSGGNPRETSRIKQPRREPRGRSKITRGGRKRG